MPISYRNENAVHGRLPTVCELATLAATLANGNKEAGWLDTLVFEASMLWLKAEQRLCEWQDQNDRMSPNSEIKKASFCG